MIPVAFLTHLFIGVNMRGKKNTVKKEEPEERPKSILGNKYKTKKLGKAVRAICPKCGRSYTSHYRVCPVCIGKE